MLNYIVSLEVDNAKPNKPPNSPSRPVATGHDQNEDRSTKTLLHLWSQLLVVWRWLRHSACIKGARLSSPCELPRNGDLSVVTSDLRPLWEYPSHKSTHTRVYRSRPAESKKAIRWTINKSLPIYHLFLPRMASTLSSIPGGSI